MQPPPHKPEPHNRITPKVILKWICGEENDGKVSRIGFWTMLSTVTTISIFLIAFKQLREVNETTAAEFSHKIKNDLYNQDNIRLITLFDDKVLRFKADSLDNIWFELDTVAYEKIPALDDYKNVPRRYNIFAIDELLQDFEDLSFYQKKDQISIDYIYDEYAYYIEMLWENPQIQSYIKWQRRQPHNSNSYCNLEHIYTVLKAMTDKER